MILLSNNFVKSNNFDSIQNQKIRNILFFSKIYGSIKYFYPSKAALNLDWDKLAIYGLKKVENCSNDNELMENIKYLFLPICNELKINTPRNENYKIIEDKKKYKIWEHYGSGVAPVGGVMKIIYKIAIKFKSNVKKISKNDTIFYFSEFIDTNLYYTIPTASNENKLSKEYKLLKKNLDTISLKKIDFKTNESFLTAKNKIYQIGSMISIWNNFRFFHPYNYINKVKWDSLFIETLNKIFVVNNYIDFYYIFNQFLSSLNDGHILTLLECTEKMNFLIAKQSIIYPFNIGLDLYLTDTSAMVINGHEKYLNLIPKGSKIDTINDISIKNFIDNKTEFLSGSKHRKLYKLRTEFFKSYVDSIYNIKFRNKDGENKNIQIKNKKFLYSGVNDKANTFLQEIEDNIFLMNFNSTKASKKELKRTIKILKKNENIKGLIIDLRNVKYLEHSFLGYFIKEKVKSPDWKIPIINNPYKIEYYISNWKIKPKKTHFNLPIVFLIDASIISYGETIVDIIKFYKIGKLVGTNTAGCNGNATRFITTVFNIYFYTGMRVDKLDGNILFNKGILPDYYIENSGDDILNGIDNQLNKAIEIIKNEK